MAPGPEPREPTADDIAKKGEASIIAAVPLFKAVSKAVNSLPETMTSSNRIRRETGMSRRTASPLMFFPLSGPLWGGLRILLL